MANQQMISAAASSSTPSSESLKKYDVFLSFRGEDTRSNITSHLYHALTQEKVETYIDYELKRGDEISPALMKAIEESHASIIIFSENYASSKWCLDELSKILECNKDQGQVVIPVFYKIDPSHVRKQTGSYKQAFAKHERDLRHNKDKVLKWKAALTKAASLAGFDFKNYRTEVEFIKDIVGVVLEKLNLRYPIELKELVGIEENYAKIASLLEIASTEVRIIGIWGMGGIGKTTLATALYAKLSSLFDGHCFLANVREESAKKGPNSLRKKLFSELLNQENLNLDAPGLESKFVMTRLRGKRVFVVLDDVATSKQLEDLIIDYDCLGLGSRIIVTTRNKQVFTQVHEIYEVKKLNVNDSLQLFCVNAFTEKHPKNGYEELLEGVIAYCKGIPLALKVLGARLRRRSKEAWKSELRKLEKIPDVEIHNVLRLSYDDLDRTQKDIFLDIACFFKGESIDHVTSLLEACNFFPASGLEVLLDMALITISDKNTIEMHDLLQEMGWEIVHQESIKDPGRRSRLWNPEEVCDVLKYNRGAEAVEGLILDVSKIGDLHLSSDSFAKMTNLRFLKFYSGDSSDRCNVYLPDGLGSLSDKLRYLSWPGYCREPLPSIFCVKMLVELHIPNSNLEKLWDGVQDFVNLKTINISRCKNLVEVPDLSMAANLNAVFLEQCKSLCQVHPSILSLPKLMYLSLVSCTQIESLKTDIHLKSLSTLKLDYCSSLKEFSVTSEEMKFLFLDGTAIQELPSSIWHNRKLCRLSLEGCDNLNIVGKKLSDDPGVRSLRELNLTGCKQLNASNLCFILDGVRSLRSLYLTKCCNLQALPDNIALLSSLRFLNLEGSNVESLPASIKNLSMLKRLFLDNCKKLVFVPELPPSLQMLSATNCTSLEKVFNLNSVEIVDGLRSLRRLYLSNCCNLQILPDSIGLLSSLQLLDLSGNNVERLSASIKNLSMLKVLFLDNCMKLVALPELPPSLKQLHAVNCTSLDIDFTQRLVLEHKLQNISYSLKHGHEDYAHDDDQYDYVLIPGAQVPDLFCLCTAETSITIPYHPQSDLCGFIFCIILSESFSYVEDFVAYCFINKHGEVDSDKSYRYLSNENLISDHVLLWYADIKYLHNIQKSGANDHYNISFEFKIDYDRSGDMSGEGIKECGVLPIYASESELELGGSTKDIVELEPKAQSSSSAQSSHKQEPLPWTNNLEKYIFQPDFDELRPRAIGKIHLPTTQKLQEVKHQTIKTGTQMQNEIGDLNEKCSCGCFIGLMLKHLWGLISNDELGESKH